MRTTLSLSGLLLITLMCAVPPVGAKTLVLYPVDGAVVVEEGGQIVGFCDDPEIEEVAITLNGKLHRVELWDGVFDLDLDWAEGANELQVGSQTLHFTSDPYATTFKQPVVHQAMLDNCANCHVLGAERDLTLVRDPSTLCRGCHEAVAAAVTHGSLSCGECHAPHTSWNPRRLLRTGNALCLQCHRERTGEAGVAHSGLWGELTCTTCHGGHQPRVGSVGEHCGRCHAGKQAVNPGHQAAVDTGCQVCHTMHGLAGKGLWKDPADSCLTCHPPRDDPEHAGAVAACGDCHGVHTARDPVPSGERCRPCHRELMTKQRLHGPEAVGQCGACHPLHDPRNRSAALFSCTGCHGMEKLQGGHTGSVVGFDTCVLCHRLHASDEAYFLPPIQHTPFAERRCGDCHDRPGFDAKRKYAGAWTALCSTCHDGVPGAGKPHGPLAEGLCQACHVPHASPWPAHLRDAPRALCLSCHGEIAAKLATGGPHSDRLTCTDCHDPHGGPSPHYLKVAGNALCTGCHSDPTLDLGGVLKPYVHGPLNTVGCVFCHDPHGSAGGPQLRLPVQELCAGCHEEVAPARSAPDLHVHPPVAAGGCTDCHRPHAAPNKGLLLRAGNALCLPCHDPARHSHPLAPRTGSSFATVPADWPRDGEKLACRSCHAPHTSKEKRLFVKPRQELCNTCHRGI